jgi:predicted Zn-dependent peptidase
MRITGVIQAGGKSTRMGGEPKALIELGGRRIVERVVAAIEHVVDDVLVVTNTPERYAFLGLPMVGDVFPAEVKRLAEKYFSKIPRRADPPVVRTQEPVQKGQRRFVLPGDTQPIFGMGFHRPVQTHADDPALSVLGSVLGDGRTSRLYKRMVKDEKSALAVGSFNGFPGSKFPTLFIVFAIPNSGFSPEQMETVSFEEIKKVQDGGITDEELTRIKTQTRAGFIRNLEGNQGLAGALAEYEILRGSWEKLFDEVARIEAVTREQVQQAARTYLTVENSTVGHMVTKSGDKTVAKSN